MRIILDDNVPNDQLVSKELEELSFEECKQALLSRHRFKLACHPESAFQPIINNEMRLLTERIKQLKSLK